MLRLALPVALALAASGCSLFVGSDCGQSALAAGTVAASVDGAAATSSCVEGELTAGTLSLHGDLGSPEARIHLTVPGAQAGQTYAVGGASDLGVATYDARGEGRRFTAAPGTGRGTVTLHAVSASGARGTFAFTGRDAAGAAVSVTDGEFDIEF